MSLSFLHPASPPKKTRIRVWVPRKHPPPTRHTRRIGGRSLSPISSILKLTIEPNVYVHVRNIKKKKKKNLNKRAVMDRGAVGKWLSAGTIFAKSLQHINHCFSSGRGLRQIVQLGGIDAEIIRDDSLRQSHASVYRLTFLLWVIPAVPDRVPTPLEMRLQYSVVLDRFAYYRTSNTRGNVGGHIP
jgi:hypothetical protein